MSKYFSARILIRLAVFAVLFFAAGHTMGEAGRKSEPTTEESAVLTAMQSHKFPVGEQMRSYDELYTGMSVNLSIALVGLAILLWLLSGLTETHARACGNLLWAPILILGAYTVTGFLFFFLAPTLTCFIATILLILAQIRLRANATP